MKKYVFFGIVLLLTMTLIPLSQLKTTLTVRDTVAAFVPHKSDRPVQSRASGTVRLRRAKSNTVETVDRLDYICGVVAAEMPAEYEKEALKAQAVAADTFLRRRQTAASGKAYDISDDYTVDQAYLSEAECREKWGEKADTYLEKIRSAVRETEYDTVLYEGKPALTVYHAVSSGKTESSADIWGGKLPYLIPVSSDGDRLAPNYKSTVVFSAAELKEKLKSLVTFSGKPEKYVGKAVRTESGAVRTIRLCGTELTGASVRAALDLKSTNFELSFLDGKFSVTTYGRGHGVGMSQYGANRMAKQGSDYREILLWYYPGCTVEKIKA